MYGIRFTSSFPVSIQKMSGMFHVFRLYKHGAIVVLDLKVKRCDKKREKKLEDIKLLLAVRQNE